MGKIINYDDFCKEVDKGDLLVGNNAEWAKEIAWRTPEASLPSCEGSNEGKTTVNLTSLDRAMVCGALYVLIEKMAARREMLEEDVKEHSNSIDIEKLEAVKIDLEKFRELAQKFEG